MNVDPDALFAGLPGCVFINDFGSTLPDSPTGDDLAERLRSVLPDVTLRTADDASAHYRQLFAEMSEPWQ